MSVIVTYDTTPTATRSPAAIPGQPTAADAPTERTRVVVTRHRGRPGIHGHGGLYYLRNVATGSEEFGGHSRREAEALAVVRGWTVIGD